LLGASYVVAIVNRWREGGPQLTLYASAGIAGAVTFLGIGSLATGLYLSADVLVVAGVAVAVLGLVFSGVGFFVAAGGGAAGAVQAVVEVFDAAVRTGSNLVSFSRLAAFGLTHAALGWLVWAGTTGLAQHGGISVLAAVVVLLDLRQCDHRDQTCAEQQHAERDHHEPRPAAQRPPAHRRENRHRPEYALIGDRSRSGLGTGTALYCSLQPIRGRPGEERARRATAIAPAG
jgi:hypothetical protein